jgi:hypothetical protein
MSRAELTEETKAKVERDTNDNNVLLLTKVVRGGTKAFDAAVAAGVQSGRFFVADHELIWKFIVEQKERHGEVPLLETIQKRFPLFFQGDTNESMSVVLENWSANYARVATGQFFSKDSRFRSMLEKESSPHELGEVLSRFATDLSAVGQNGHGRLRVTSSADIKPEVPAWTWEHNGVGIIPANGLTVLVGDPGEGKGLWGCWVASHATRGRRGFPKMKVAVLGHEDALGIQRGRLDAAGSAPIVFLDTEDDLFMSFPTDIDLLRKAIEAYELELVIVDPINNHLDDNIRTSDDKEMRKALSPLNKLGQELGTTIICVTHMSKGTVGAKLLYRAGGSIAISGASRQMLFLGAKTDTEAENYDPDERFLFQGKTNYARQSHEPLKFRIEEQQIEVGDKFEPVAAMQFIGSDESGVSIEDVFSSPRGRGRPRNDELREWLDTQLDGRDEIPAQELRDAAHVAGHSVNTVRHVVRNELGWDTVRVGRGNVWRRPMAQGLQLVSVSDETEGEIVAEEESDDE